MNELASSDADNFRREDLRIRNEMALAVEEMDVIQNEEAAVFLVGDEDAIVHSEPPITEQRFFVSILVGTENQIKEWREENNIE